MDFSNMDEAGMNRAMYNKVLDGYLIAVDTYADISLRVKSGEITAEQAIAEYDAFLKPKAVLLLMLDQIRGADSFVNRMNTAETLNADDIDAQVAAFRNQLDGI